ncbi:uncharacterized protein LOC134660208 [Cydia amplana]|uniref:uncharacterized protein LOC134660208 n=1 Tax=Cydia amplana TaxID=1869771 RepID=UPI002FE6BFDE
MDSFFSLFDPSDGNQNKTKRKQNKPDQDNVKKKLDPPKGRRRGRKTQGKNETLPEESSFLCEPELSAELLMKDGSYFESYIELKKEDPKADDKKPKRRNSGRKNRRRKKVRRHNSRVSPAKEESAWTSTTSAPSACADAGKVNDLRDYGGGVHGVIDKLEKVILKDDTYLAGEFNSEDLHNEAWYSSDDLDESLDDTNSESEDSGSEAHGSLPPEPRFGNVEYKLQLVAPCERRFQHLVTQLAWRLRSGGGAAVYLLGVRDCGALRGLRARGLRGSLATLRRMAAALGATLHHVTARRVRRHRAVAEVYIRKLADTQQSVELRVAVMGANEAGKSTLIGVLTQGELDNGRGSARLNMFRHLHEVKSGRTSSLSHEILGFDAQGNVVNYGCSELMTAERIGERSSKLVSFLDLAGHSKYQRTTLHGLTGYCPHYAMLVISATAGITRITEEHIGLLLALALPFFCVVSKCELAALQPLLTRLQGILAAANKKPLLITDENMARNCVGPQRLILDTIDGIDHPDDSDDEPTTEQIPVFPVSCVKGAGLNALHAYLLALQPPATDLPPADHETCEFQIDEIFHVGESPGPVVGGLLARGTLHEGDNLILGPLDTGEFVPISVKSIYRNRVPCGRVRAGQSASLGLAGLTPGLRPGMVLLAAPEPRRGQRPTFGGCPPGKCKKSKVNEILQNQPKHKKHKNRNVYQELGETELSLTNDASYTQDNTSYTQDNTSYTQDNMSSTQDIYVSDEECTCRDEVLLEDPSDPRGCMYFQDNMSYKQDIYVSDEECTCRDEVLLEDPSDPRGCMYFQDIYVSDEECTCRDEVLLEDPSDPRGCMYFQDIYVSDEECTCRDEVLLEDPSDPRGCMYFQDIYVSDEECTCRDEVLLEDPSDPRGCMYFQDIYVSDEECTCRDEVLLEDPSDPRGCMYFQDIYVSDEECTCRDEVLLEDPSDPRGCMYFQDNMSYKQDIYVSDEECTCRDEVLLEDPSDPRGCMYFQATIHVLRHSTAISPGFQCTVHVGNVRQTAIIEGIMSHAASLRCGESAPALFRFLRCPEHLVRGRRLLLAAGGGTRAIGRITQIFPYVP